MNIRYSVSRERETAAMQLLAETLTPWIAGAFGLFGSLIGIGGALLVQRQSAAVQRIHHRYAALRNAYAEFGGAVSEHFTASANAEILMKVYWGSKESNAMCAGQPFIDAAQQRKTVSEPILENAACKIALLDLDQKRVARCMILKMGMLKVEIDPHKHPSVKYGVSHDPNRASMRADVLSFLSEVARQLHAEEEHELAELAMWTN